MKRRTALDYNNCDIEIAAAEGAIDVVKCCLVSKKQRDTFHFDHNVFFYMTCNFASTNNVLKKYYA